MKDSLILFGGFLDPNMEARNRYLNHGRKGGCPNLQEYRMKVDISSFSENLEIKFFLDWIYEVDKLYVLMEKQVKFVVYKLK